MHPVAALDQHAQRRIEILALIGAIESVGKQHDLAPAFRSKCFAHQAKTCRGGTRAGRAWR